MSKREHSQDLFNPFERMQFTNAHCFLCGSLLQDQSTAEHVFPKWLQNKFELWDRSIHLLNGTTIPYRRLTIPCCKTCNGEYLSQLEIDIRNAVEGGFEEFKKLDPVRVFQWISKLFYGLLFKELSLPVDIRNRQMGSIMKAEVLERFQMVHVFLQSIRIPFDFDGHYPFSIHLVRTQSTGDSYHDFDYADNFPLLTFSIRMGEIGIVASLQDGGADRFTHSEYYERLQNYTLHPLQFRELVARNTYSSSLMNRVPKFVVTFAEGGDVVLVITMPLGGMIGGPLFDEWDNAEYVKYLHFYTLPYIKAEYEDLYVDGRYVTFLFNEDDSFKEIPVGSKIKYQPQHRS